MITRGDAVVGATLYSGTIADGGLGVELEMHGLLLAMRGLQVPEIT